MAVQLRYLPARLGLTQWNNVAYPEGQILFLLNGKCGNSSIKTAILAAQGKETDKPHRRTRLLSRLQVRGSGYRKIAITRNPYARAVSLWQGKVKSRAESNAVLRNCGFTRDMDFLACMRQLARIDPFADKHIRPQSAAFFLWGQPLWDDMLKIEDPATWPHIQARAPGLPDLPKVNVSNAPDWRPLCEGEAGEIIRHVYRRDFEICGYQPAF